MRDQSAANDLIDFDSFSEAGGLVPNRWIAVKIFGATTIR
jgi:hypothetical protein